MSATIITHAAGDGWVGWADGRPPRLACGMTREAVQAQLREPPPAVQPDAVPAAPLQVSVLLSRKRPLLNPGRVFAHIAKSGRPAARIIIGGADPFNEWPLVESWIVNCGDQLRRNGAGLAIAIQIESRLPPVPAGFMDFACRNAGWCALTVLDDGEDEALSRRRQDRAAELTDLGCRVSAKLGLARGASDRWSDLAEQWRAITRGESVAFTRPVEREVPDPEDVASFLMGVFEGRRFDLWETDPFATLLGALCGGLETVPRCGTPHVAGLSGTRFVLGCRSGSLECAQGRGRRCACAFGPLCDAVEGTCGSHGAGASGRTFCRAMQVLVPRFLQELAVAARYQQFLQDRRADERFLMDARGGRIDIWRDMVATEHSDRCGEDDGNRNDVSPGRDLAGSLALSVGT